MSHFVADLCDMALLLPRGDFGLVG